LIISFQSKLKNQLIKSQVLRKHTEKRKSENRQRTDPIIDLSIILESRKLMQGKLKIPINCLLLETTIKMIFLIHKMNQRSLKFLLDFSANKQINKVRRNPRVEAQ